MLPSDRAMKKVSQRAYQREHPNQRAPPTLSDLVLPNDFKTCVLLQVLGNLSTDHLNRVVHDMATCYQPISIWGDGHLGKWHRF